MEPLPSDKKFPLFPRPTVKPPEPKLFYITPRNLNVFDLAFVAEFLLVTLQFALVIIYVRITRRSRVNGNVKYLSYFYILAYGLFLASRIVIILIQGYYMVHQEDRNSPASAAVILCSFIEGYYIILLLTCVFWIAMERLHARWCIRDYEADPDYRVSCNVLSCAASIGIYGSALCTSGYIPWSSIVVIGVVSMFLGAVIIFICYRNTQEYYQKVCKRKSFNAMKMKSEAEANIWNSKLLIQIAIINTVLNCLTLGGFAAVFLQEHEEEHRKLYYCFATIFLHFNSPIMAGILLFSNEYLRSVARTLFCPAESTYVPEEPTRIFNIGDEGPRRNSLVVKSRAVRRIGPM